MPDLDLGALYARAMAARQLDYGGGDLPDGEPLPKTTIRLLSGGRDGCCSALLTFLGA
jgi:hypothetical protein